MKLKKKLTPAQAREREERYSEQRKAGKARQSRNAYLNRRLEQHQIEARREREETQRRLSGAAPVLARAKD